MAEKIPLIPPYSPFAPSAKSVDGRRLEYASLEPAAMEHAPYERQRSSAFWDAEPDSLEELYAADQLARHYLLLTSFALNKTVTARSADIWSDRFTISSSELFGLPDPQVAQQLFESQQLGHEAHHMYEAEARLIGEYLNEKYADVYEALDLTDGDEEYSAVEVADKFESALGILGLNHDKDWDEWSIVRPDTDNLAVHKETKEISVGSRRRAMTSKQIKMLFTHEVLVHAQRSMYGYKKSDFIGKGLPGYEGIEEGFGVFMGYAATGVVSDRVQDKYVDMAYALGMIDGQKHARAELVELAMARALKRNENADTKRPYEAIEADVYSHINRMYRGSRGDEHIGVFTKDVFYYKGFLDIGSYISKELGAGKTIEQVMDWLMAGKFDPTNERHVKTIEAHIV